ncbi:MAG: sulfite exporter TauE/SafE family protein [Spirochaetaceae bacterium]|nr:sulfite exporter TauE/SafE family protein [Spirochaetaceae bacterium]
MSFLGSLGIGQWAALMITAILVGFTKAGLEGASIIAIPIMAGAFGARQSSAIIMGIMVVSDLAALWKYHSHVNLKILLRTLPPAIMGIALGTIVGKKMPEGTFKVVVGILIMVSAVLMLIQESRRGGFVLPERWYIAVPLGMLAGFSSMVGNAGGPIFGLFMLSSGLLKNSLIGTTTWFFAIINGIRLPLNIFVWHTFTLSTLKLVLAAAPLALISVLAGARLVQKIPEKPYRYFRLAAVAVGGIYLLLG